MIPATAIRSAVLGLLALLIWGGTAHAVPCQNNLPASNPNSVYTDHGNGTVTDKRTGLMWKQCPEGQSGAGWCTGLRESLTWANALARADASTFGGYTDWRLPNVKELSSLIEECRVSPAINTSRFPNTGGVFWSSSPSALNSGGATRHVVDFSTGWVYESSGYVGVRLVRGGQ